MVSDMIMMTLQICKMSVYPIFEKDVKPSNQCPFSLDTKNELPKATHLLD